MTLDLLRKQRATRLHYLSKLAEIPRRPSALDVMANQTLALSLVLQGPRCFLVRLALAEDLIDENCATATRAFFLP